MKNVILSCLTILLIIFGCSEKEPTEPITYTDSELKAKIIGTWLNDFESYNFDENGNFTKNIYAETIKGTYDIVDGILTYNSITEWNLDTSKHYESFGLLLYKLSFNRDKLYLYPISILTRIGEDTDSLWGEWYTFNWAHKYADPQTFGKFENTYEFNKDSMMVTILGSISFDSSEVFPSTFPITYNPPELIIDDSPTITIVEFHTAKMWWFYKLDEPPIPLTKHK